MTDIADQPSLLRRTAKAAGWIIGWRVVTRGLGVVSTLALVRLLAPSDFGLVALGTAFAQSIEAFSVLGVEDVVVRAHEPDRALYNTAFTINALRGLVTAVALAVVSAPMADFFGDSRLQPILLALAAATLIAGFENIGVVDFRRSFAFNKEFKLQILPRIAGIVLTVGSAVVLRSYWALVIGIVSTRTLRTVLGYSMHPFRPRVTLQAWRSMIGFSVWTWFISLAGLLRDRAPSFVVARVVGAVQLGFLTVADEIGSLPSSELLEPLCRACFSSFAAARNHATSAAETYARVVSMTALITLPAGLGISIVADPLVRVALGPEWLPAILPIQILAAGGSLSVIRYVSSTLFSAHAILETLFRLTAWMVALRILFLVLLTIRFGIVGSALALTAATLVEQGCFLVATCRQFGLCAHRLAVVMWRGVVAVAVMVAALDAGGLAWTSKTVLAYTPLVQLAAVSCFGAVIYTVTLIALWLASGRPDGPEADIMAMLARLRPMMRDRYGTAVSAETS